MTHDLTLSQNKEYRSWVKELKQRYLSARLKASVDANRTLLEYYWSVGRDIEDKQYANTYGSRFYETLSHDMRSEMPGEKGFSEGNIRYMYRFYKLYSQCIGNLLQGVEDSNPTNLLRGVHQFQQNASGTSKRSCPADHQRPIRIQRPGNDGGL